MKHLFLFSSLFLFFTTSTLNAQKKDNKAKKDSSFIAAYPFVFYFPETDLGFGLAGIYTFYPGKTKSKNPSLVQVGGAYTLKKQLLLNATYNLFLNDNTYEVFGEFGYYDYLFPYFGIGNDTKFANEETYFARFPRIEFNGLKKIGKSNFRAGITLKYDNYQIYETKPEGVLERVSPRGINGSVITKLGGLFRYDSRDIIYNPTKGYYATLELSSFNKDFGGSSSFNKLLLNASSYHKIANKQVLALNIETGALAGEVPFQELVDLGGPKTARGIVDGRFRDKTSLAAQIEYRYPVYKRFSGVAFSSLGSVGTGMKETLLNKYHHNYGLGLRFLLDQENKINMRFDFALGSEQPAFYLTFKEAF